MFKAGDTLAERYELQKQLGHTAIGHQTWLAVDRQSGERVTLKLLAFNPQMQWEELKLFDREAQVLKSLDCQRIPQYRDCFDIDKTVGNGIPWFVLVQNYIVGSSLQELLDNGYQFAEPEVRSIATEVLDILIYLHELNPPVLHRDIKPSNLILGEDRHIYLVDFGAVQAQAAITGVTFTIVGTGGYAPLEQFWGRAVPASDLYALGATLVHLLTGIAPIDLPQQDYRIQFSDRVNIQSDFLAWLETITNIAADKRFSSARDALKALRYGRILSIARFQDKGLRKIAVPKQTAIAFNKSQEQLDFYIPPGGAKRLGECLLNSGFLGSAIVTGLIVILVVCTLGDLSPQSVSAAIAIVPFLLFFISLLTIPFANLFVEETFVSIDNNYMTILKKSFNYKIEWLQYRNTDIYGVFIDNKGGNYRVSIRANQGVCSIGGALNEHESIWLAQEIRDWLNLR